MGKSKWGLTNGGLSPLSAICAQSSTIVHFCVLFGPLFKGTFCRKMTTIVGNRGQLWTSTLSPHVLSPHLDYRKITEANRNKSGHSRKQGAQIWTAPKASHLNWKDTKEYLNQRGTKIRVFRVLFRAPFLPPFSPNFSPLFPLQALFTLPPPLPSSPPPFTPPFLTPGKLRFRYPSDLGTL